MKRIVSKLMCLTTVMCLATAGLAEEPSRVQLSDSTRQQCLEILRQGMHGDEFWPAIHAAEGLTLGGYSNEVIEYLSPKLSEENDDQRRCGLARELVRAGDHSKARIMLDILAGESSYGHVHAAESLYKVGTVGDGNAMRAAFAQTEDLRLRLMAAAALGRCGHPGAMAFLRETVRHDDPEVARLAVWVLGRIGDQQDVSAIRENLSRAPDALTRAYFEHSLAALGDSAGITALLKNLGSDDPAVRTYAATFAGDARATDAVEGLQGLLNDPHPDAQIRAAQSLLVLAGPPPADRTEDVSVLVYKATKEHPRYTEGSIIELNDGALLYAVTEFHGSGSDFAKARITARRSVDGGRTWGEPRVLQANTGGQNVMSVTLRRLAPPAEAGTIALFYLEKNSYDDLDLKVRFSTDEAATFSEPVLVTDAPGYHVVNNDRILQLSTGRLLAPAASTADVRKVNHFTCRCFFSDDGGRSWHMGQGAVDLPKRGAMEPDVVELNDGRVMMIMRNQLGTISKSYSSDGGDTWSDPETLGDLIAPEAPATIRRIPSTGDLLLIWNNNYTAGAGHGGKRTPLSAALSSDDGETWHVVGNLEPDANRQFSYTSLIFAGDRAVMSYWDSPVNSGRYSSRFRSLPISWFYR